MLILFSLSPLSASSLINHTDMSSACSEIFRSLKAATGANAHPLNGLWISKPSSLLIFERWYDVAIDLALNSGSFSGDPLSSRQCHLMLRLWDGWPSLIDEKMEAQLAEVIYLMAYVNNIWGLDFSSGPSPDPSISPEWNVASQFLILIVWKYARKEIYFLCCFFFSL